MRTYRNTVTGVIVCVDAEVKGEWEEIPAPASDAPEPVKEAKPVVKKAKTPRKKK